MKFNYQIQRLAFVLLFVCVSVSCQEEIGQQKSAIGLLQHTVYFYLNDDVTAEQAEQFEAGLHELMQISEIYKYELGIPADTEVREVTDHSFAYSIFSWFESLEDYDVYAEHPDHLEFINTYQHLWANVRVYDSQIWE